MPDFSKPGSDGELPADYVEWERGGVIYTVRPRLLSPLRSGEVYRINIQVQRAGPEGFSRPPYAHLYERATAIANARAAELACLDREAPIHTWILSQEWFGIERLPKQKPVGVDSFAAAFLTIGLMCLDEGEPPHGKSACGAPANFTPFDRIERLFRLARTTGSATPARESSCFGEGLESRVGAEGLSFPQAQNFLRWTFACFTQWLSLWKSRPSGYYGSNNC